MQANLRPVGWHCVSALALVLSSQTLALAQFSTAIPAGIPPATPAPAPPAPPALKERALPPPPTFPVSSPSRSKARSAPPRPKTLIDVLRSLSAVKDPPAVSKKAAPAAQKTSRGLQLTNWTDGPRPLPAAKKQVTTAELRFAERLGAAGRSVSTPRTTATSRLPEIRLRPIGVIPPEDGP